MSLDIKSRFSKMCGVYTHAKQNILWSCWSW